MPQQNISKNLFLTLTLSMGLSLGCASSDPNKHTKEGTGIGAAAGTLVGGILGHQTGKRNEGAVLGAVLGGALGGYSGRRMDKQAEELRQVAETKRTEEGLVTKLKSDILFDTGKSQLKPAAEQNLKQMAEIMKKYPENVLTVQGYTDSTGSAKINEELSRKRAEAVREVLVAHGMPAAEVTAKGLGPADPVADNKSSDGRAKNRRVEVQVTVDPSKVPAEKK